jgi:copper resistance protein D
MITNDRQWLLAGIIVLVYLLLFFVPPTWSQEHAHHGHSGMSMSADEPTEGMLNDWKRESEGNHHLIGFLIAVSGLFMLAQSTLAKKFRVVGYVWPVCFLLSGLFVLVYSDTELWPFGPKPWIQGTLTNPEVIQHKLFAILLLAVGLIEMERVRRRLTVDWVKWVFPALAVTGSILLLFHSHSSGMRGPNHMAIMARIQSEHLSYAAAGFSIGMVKGFAEIPTKWQIVFAKVWPILMIVLGVLLMCYVE